MADIEAFLTSSTHPVIESVVEVGCIHAPRSRVEIKEGSHVSQNKARRRYGAVSMEQMECDKGPSRFRRTGHAVASRISEALLFMKDSGGSDELKVVDSTSVFQILFRNLRYSKPMSEVVARRSTVNEGSA